MPFRAASPAASENELDISGALLGASADTEENLFGVEDHAHAQTAGPQIDEKELGDGFMTDGEDDAAFIVNRQFVANKQRLSAGKKPKGGSFQSMGLDTNLSKAITRKGFSIPTPIQRKAIPMVLDGQDIVASARTGSGKTAAFVIPMIQQLKAHKTQVGARALIMSPSRELALQTVKVVNELGKGTDLRTMLVVGGDSMEDQFKAMTSNPDIIIATPGRFLHLQIEMGLDLSSFRYVVFDEADRLFEMGFAAQLSEILHALPSSRQTLLFSATLPKSLVEFARAGLSEPKLVRLDAETKVSSDLENAFFTIKSAEKEAALLHIFNDVIKMVPQSAKIANSREAEGETKKSRKRKRGADGPERVADNATIVFTATKHHVEYITSLLRAAGFAVSYIYSSLDQTARKINIQQFRTGQTSILVVTDIAARGVDIPILSNVINYDFASSAKLWVHRVGRTARAGRSGWSYNLITTRDVPYMLDLQLFMSKRLVLGRSQVTDVSFAEDFVVGTLPRDKVEQNAEWVNKLLEGDEDIAALRTVASKGEKLYNKTRNSASPESVKRSKEILTSASFNELSLLFGEGDVDNTYEDREALLKRIRGFRPDETVFEVGKRGIADETAEMIRKAREHMDLRRQKAKRGSATDEEEVEVRRNHGRTKADQSPFPDNDADTPVLDTAMESASEAELEVTFSNSKSAADATHKDSEFFMSYTPRSTNLAEDRALSVHGGSNSRSFLMDARNATLDMGNDESKGFGEASRAKPLGMRWDKKAKKYVSRANDMDGSREGGKKYIKGESGQKIAASFRSGRFEAWKKRERIDRLPRVGERESVSAAGGGGNPGQFGGRHFRHKLEKTPKAADKYRDDYHRQKKKVDEAKEKRIGKFAEGKGKSEIRSVDKIAKERMLKERRREKTARPSWRKGRN